MLTLLDDPDVDITLNQFIDRLHNYYLFKLEMEKLTPKERKSPKEWLLIYLSYNGLEINES